MRTQPLAFRGALLLKPQVHADDRGTFHRVVDFADLLDQGLDPAVAQVSVATNRRCGTVRGLHYQVAPHVEAKTLWCTRGSVFDVIVDLRSTEPSYGQWLSVELTAARPRALYIPPGMAHGYQTLADDTELVYLISTPYDAASARVLNWQDPMLAIDWPLPVSAISARDSEAPVWPPSP